MVNLSNLRQNKQDQQGTSGLDSSEILALAGSGVSVFDTLDSLPSSPSEGDKALVDNINRLYISDGSGWYNIDLSTGFTPYWLTEPDATYEITDSVTPLLVTAKALDSDGTTPINQSFASDSAQYMVTVTNDSSVFTFTPKSADSIGIEVGAGNLTDSNGDFIYTFKWSDGINFVSKSVTIGYSPAGSSVTISDYTGDRALVGGVSRAADGGSGADYTQIQYFDITLNSNSSAFGQLNNATRRNDTMSDSTTAVFTGTSGTTIEYKTFATTGNASLWSGTMIDSYMGVNGGQFSDGIWGISYKASYSGRK